METNELKKTIEFLTKVSFFSEVSKKPLSHLCQNLTSKSFKEKETIFQKDDAGDSMYVILSGTENHHSRKIRVFLTNKFFEEIYNFRKFIEPSFVII